MLTLFIEEDGDVTPVSVGRYAEVDDEPTVRWNLEKSDAIWESQERMRMGNVEAAGVWLLVAGGLE